MCHPEPDSGSRNCEWSPIKSGVTLNNVINKLLRKNAVMGQTSKNIIVSNKNRFLRNGLSATHMSFSEVT
jgi:hypothetical protein